MTMATTAVRIERQEAVWRLWLSRPEVHNALNESMIAALAATFREAASDEACRAIVLGAEGATFCAGADIAEMRRLVDSTIEDNVRHALGLAELFATVHGCPKPVIARVQGAAYGGGVGLVAASDVVIAGASARFGLTEARLGIAPAVIAPYVIRRLGPGRTAELAVSGEVFDAQRAAAIGLVTHVVPDLELDSAVEERLASVLRGGPQALAAIKQLVDRVAGDPRAWSHAMAAELVRLRSSPEGREGLAAFLEHRPPIWTRTPLARPVKEER